MFEQSLMFIPCCCCHQEIILTTPSVKMLIMDNPHEPYRKYYHYTCWKTYSGNALESNWKDSNDVIETSCCFCNKISTLADIVYLELCPYPDIKNRLLDFKYIHLHKECYYIIAPREWNNE